MLSCVVVFFVLYFAVLCCAALCSAVHLVVSNVDFVVISNFRFVVPFHVKSLY